MNITPKYILNQYKVNRLDKLTVVDQLISLIEDTEDLAIRLECIESLNSINANTIVVYKLLENLLISDLHEAIRCKAASTLFNLFQESAFEPLKWAFLHEESVNNLIHLTKILGNVESPNVKNLLLQKLTTITKNPFNTEIKVLTEQKPIISLTSNLLSDVLMNYYILEDLEKKFGQINFKLTNGRITELDLSDVSSHVFGWTVLNKFPEVIKYLT